MLSAVSAEMAEVRVAGKSPVCVSEGDSIFHDVLKPTSGDDGLSDSEMECKRRE